MQKSRYSYSTLDEPYIKRFGRPLNKTDNKSNNDSTIKEYVDKFLKFMDIK